MSFNSHNLEDYFGYYRSKVIGNNLCMRTPYHESIRLLYTDWTASGRMFEPIERRLEECFLPLVANTHTDTNYTGSDMTHAYHEAKHMIKRYVGANEQDVLISSNSGMTGVINKFQRILGLRIHEHFRSRITISEAERPIVFITHMEHHSNQTSWLETIAEVMIVAPDEQGLVSLHNFKQL